MSISWGIVSLALLAVESPTEKARFEVRCVDACGVAVGRTPVEAEQVTFEVRVVDTPAASWRESTYRHCKRVAREGRSTVWTLDDRAVAEMLSKIQGDMRANVVQCPKVTAEAGAMCLLDTRHTRTMVVDVDRVADGPVDQASAIAFQPAVDVIREGMLARLSGRKTAGGVRAHLAIESTWVGNVVESRTTETIHNKEHGKTSLTATMQIPQVIEARVDGDFEIPARQMILISLGTVTTADAKGKAVVMERLALIAARPVMAEAEEAALATKGLDQTVKTASAYMPTVGGLPPLPARSPVPIGPDGKVVALPPLPDPAVVPASARLHGKPTASPQALPAIPIAPILAGRPDPIPIGRSPLVGTAGRVASAAPKADPAVSRSRFDTAPAGVAGQIIDGRTIAGGGTQTIRIPVSGKISIELKARVIPAEQPE